MEPVPNSFQTATFVTGRPVGVLGRGEEPDLQLLDGAPLGALRLEDELLGCAAAGHSPCHGLGAAGCVAS